MRIKQTIITAMALTTLFGCGTNNTESMDNRQLDRVENVRHQSGQREMYGDDLNQFPDDQRNRMDQRPDINKNQLGENRNDSPGRNMLEDGQVNRDNHLQDRSNQEGEYRVAERIADQVTSEVAEIDRAYVLTMGNNAYVACQIDNDRELNENNDMSDKLEKEVTQAVKDADNKIDHVFVSSNPDFIDLTSNYMRDVDRGEPIEGFFDQFTEMIERVFPTRDR